jgi:hypothetical protein
MSGDILNPDELARQVDELIEKLDAAVLAGGPFAVSPDTVQNLMGLSCRLYGAQINKGETYLPVGGHNAITADDALFACSGLLEAANLSPFEFGMWKNHTGR